jgi:uncharacterized lipoprotein YajG
MLHISKYFKISTFWLLDLMAESCGWLKQKDIFFFRKCIITLSHVMHIKPDTAVHTESYPFSLLPSILLLFIHCSLHCSTSHHTKTSEDNQTSNMTDDVTVSNTQSATSAESEVASVSSSSNVVIQTMAKKDVPKLYQY